MSTQWQTYLRRYEVSDTGMVRVIVASTAGPAGRLLRPSLSDGFPAYFLREPGAVRNKAYPISRIMGEACGVAGYRVSRDQVEAMRAEAERHNAALRQRLDADRAAGVMPLPAASGVGTATSRSCPFATMQTLCPDYPSWDCAAMDPLSNRMEPGVWVDMPLPPRSRRAA